MWYGGVFPSVVQQDRSVINLCLVQFDGVSCSGM